MIQLLHWHQNAILDLKEGQLSISEIARKYGRATSTIQKIQSRNNIKRDNTSSVGRKKLVDLKPISEFHRRVGMKISFARGITSVTDYGLTLGVSAQKVTHMELGFHDFTLSELITISRIVGKSIPELMEGQRVTAQTKTKVAI